MVNTPEKYIGLKVEAARQEIVKDLQTSGKIIKTEKIKHVVGICYKDHGLIEPNPSEQWFLKIKPLTELALKAIKKGDVKFAAAKYKKLLSTGSKTYTTGIFQGKLFGEYKYPRGTVTGAKNGS